MKRDAPDELLGGDDAAEQGRGSAMPKKRTQNKGMSIERWIFYEGLRMGNADTFQQYLALLPEKCEGPSFFFFFHFNRC